MKTELMTITPQQAQQWLENQGKNRKLSPKHVLYLSEEIKQGRWRLTHQGIAFGDDGKLLDGQHRLAAIIKSGIGIKSLVTTGVPVGEFTILDRGMPRDMAAITNISGFFTEIYSFLLDIYNAHSCKTNPDAVYKMHKYLGNDVTMLKEASNTGIRYYSCAAIRSAAIMNMIKSDDKEYITTLYRNLVTQNIKDLPNIALSLISIHNRQSGTHDNAGYTGRIKNYIRAYQVFDKQFKDRRLYITEDLKFEYIDKCKSIVSGIISEQSNDFKEYQLRQILNKREQELQLMRKKVINNTAKNIDASNNLLSLEACN